MFSPDQQISLLQLNKLIQQAIDAQLEPTYWVIAEIGDIRVHQRGHCYLELIQKESEQVVAKARATIWSSTYRVIRQEFEKVTNSSLKSGIKVLANLSVEYHPVYGFSLNIKAINGQFTLGERARNRAEVINRLSKEGYLELNKALPLSLVPQKIAVISSPTAAGWEDFKHQLINNSYGYHFTLKLFTASMQGDGAAASIMSALNTIEYHKYDAVVIIRGGGARTDLDCFDEYELAKAVAKLELPVLTGIGHERDETITDLAAHTALKTPTAVAEFLLEKALRFESAVFSCIETVTSRVQNRLVQQQNYLQQLNGVVLVSTNRFLKKKAELLTSYQSVINTTVKSVLRFKAQHVKNLVRVLGSASENLLCQKEAHLDNLSCHIELQDPATILKKGYTLSLNKEGKAIKIQPKAGEIVITRGYDFTFESTVNP